RRQAAGALRPRRYAAHQRHAGDVRAPLPRRPPAAGHARPPQLLERRVPGGAEADAGALSAASVAGGSVDGDADAPPRQTAAMILFTSAPSRLSIAASISSASRSSPIVAAAITSSPLVRRDGAE